MKWKIAGMLSVVLSFVAFMACGKEAKTAGHEQADHENIGINDSTATKMKIKIGSGVFSATLSDNATARAFSSLLPLKIRMTELNGNEKFFDLPSNLPSNPSSPGTIRSGDIMLWRNNTLVLFYKSFTTAYSYTRIGRIGNADGLSAALGAGNVEVSFELE